MNPYKTRSQIPQQRERFTEDFVTFMSACGFSLKDASAPFNVSLALEASYRPSPDFWRSLDLRSVQEALNVFAQRFHAAPGFPAFSDSLAKEIGDILFMNQHDERNADLLSQLSPADRPRDSESASGWICAELLRRGAHGEFEYAQRDGKRCGEAALEQLAVVEAAAQGQPLKRYQSEVAEICRRAFANRAVATPVATD